MHFKGYTLNAFQVKAATAISAGKNVLLSAPTGSGKTLVAEYAIETAVRQGRRAIYTAPIKALSNQKFRDFKEDGLQVGLMTGDLTLEPHAPVVIMTTEIFRNSVFEDPLRFEDVDFVIFDEIHFLDDPERGTVWEESLIFAPQHVRFVGLSATISNLDQFGKWLAKIRTHELEVIRHDQRPVPLEYRLFHHKAGLFDLSQKKRAMLTIQRYDRKDEIRSRGRRGRHERRPRFEPRSAHISSLALLDLLTHDGLLPVLYFCFSRKEVEIKAEKNLVRNLLHQRERTAIDQLFLDICKKFELDPRTDPALRDIRMRAARGVGFHHAGMLPIHKEVVERLFTSGLVKMLFTTETFALGINMPARTVVFDSLKKFDGVSFDYMKARDFLQMAGRAGRQGIDDAGLVIPVVEPEDLQAAPLKELFGGKVEPITSRFNLSYSTILNLYERMGKDLVQAYDRSFAAFQAETGGQKSREKKRAAARAALLAKIAILEKAGFLDDQGLLARGRIAQQINGYEIQVTELLMSGVLDRMSMEELAATFTAIVHEERRNDDARPGRNQLGPLAPAVERAISRFTAIEASFGVDSTIKMPDWGAVPAVVAWTGDATIEEVERMISGEAGDFVRTLRMAIQMMRQLRKALSGDYPLLDRLDEAIVAVNRDEVDAKRQFELG